MRLLILAAAAAALAAPGAALAQSTTFPEAMDEEIARALPHPFEVEEAGDRLGAAVGAILDVPVGGVVRALDPAARVHGHETIRDMAGRDDPHFEQRVGDELHGLTLGMADLVRQMAVVAPVLRRSLADLERNMGDAMRGRGRDYDRDWDE